MGFNAIWKYQARKALKDHWLTGLLIALIVNVPTLLVQGIAASTGNDLMTRIQETLYRSLNAEGTALDPVRLEQGLQSIGESTGVWVLQGLNAAAWLLTPCLILGMTAWLLGRLRKEEDPGVVGVFCRGRLFLKAIGLRLYVFFRIFLWMLPGVALLLLASLPVLLSGGSSRISQLNAVNTTLSLYSAAMIVTMILGAVAALKYALSDQVMADQPEMGPIRAARESRQLTKGKKGQLFGLYMSFLFWYMLEILVSGLCEGLFGIVPSLMVQMLASLALSLYMTGSISAFYLECRGETSPEKIMSELREGDQEP